MKNIRTIGLAVLTLVFLGLAVYYFVTPAESLAHFMPGYEVGVKAAHTKHALAALILAAGCGLLIWFSSGKKTSVNDDTTPTAE